MLAATELTLDGVAFSIAAIENGTYEFWGNEYIYKANSVVNSGATVNAYAVFHQVSLVNFDTAFPGYPSSYTTAIPLSQMHSARAHATSDPKHKNN